MNKHTLNIGDIVVYQTYYEIGSYSETGNCFLQIVGTNKNYVKVKRIGQDKTFENEYDGYSVPVKDAFLGRPLSGKSWYKVNKNNQVEIDRYENLYASKHIEGEQHYFSQFD